MEIWQNALFTSFLNIHIIFNIHIDILLIIVKSLALNRLLKHESQ